MNAGTGSQHDDVGLWEAGKSTISGIHRRCHFAHGKQIDDLQSTGTA